MTTLLAPDTRLQAAVIRGKEILVLELYIDDDHQCWLLPGGGRDVNDIDEAAAVSRGEALSARVIHSAPS